MIARFDHRPMLTAVLALSTTVLVVVVITLSTLLITGPQAASPQSGSVGDKPPAVVPSEHYGHDWNNVYGHDWNNYGHDLDQPKPAEPAQRDDALARHAEMVAAYTAKKP
jgi:hypothetical protein